MAEDDFFLKHVNDLRSESERIHHREGRLDIGYQLTLIFFIFIRQHNSHFNHKILLINFTVEFPRQVFFFI